MKNLMKSMNEPLLYNLKNVLELQGIECLILGAERRIGMGELPVWECMTELAIVDETKAQEAETIIERERPANLQAWFCNNCHEPIDSQFDVCWRCGAERP